MKKIMFINILIAFTATVGFTQSGNLSCGASSELDLTRGMIDSSEERREGFLVQNGTGKLGSMLIPLIIAGACLLYTSPSPRDKRQSRMPSSA